MPTQYPYAAGVDPGYDAWSSQYAYGKEDATRQAGVQRQRSGEDYKNALTGLDDQQTKGARNIDVGLLGRGMYRSGERNVRQDELSKDIGTSRGLADTAYQRRVGDISGDLQRALATLDLQNEQQVGAAVGRKNAADQAAAAQAESDRQFQAGLDQQKAELEQQKQAAADAAALAEQQGAAQAAQYQAQADAQAAWDRQQAEADARWAAMASSVSAPAAAAPVRAAPAKPAAIKVMPTISYKQPPKVTKYGGGRI